MIKAMLQDSTRMLQTLAVFVFFALCSDAQEPPDGSYEDSSGLGYSLDDIIGDVGTLFGQDLAGQISGEVATGTLTVGELYTPTNVDGTYINAATGPDGIWLQTKTPHGELSRSRLLAALALAHEYGHVCGARERGKSKHPEDGSPCGGCEHAIMSMDQAFTLAFNEICETGEPGEKLELCEAILACLNSIEDSMTRCSAQVCPGGHADASNFLDLLNEVLDDLFSDCCAW